MKTTKIQISILLCAVMLLPYINVFKIQTYAQNSKDENSFSFMSFNAENEDGKRIVSAVYESSPSVFTVLSADKDNLSLIGKELRDYKCVIDLENSNASSVNTIFYKDPFRCIKTKTVSLSGTPDKADNDNVTSGRCCYSLLQYDMSESTVAIFAANITANDEDRQLMYLYSKYQCYRDYYPTILSVNDNSENLLENFDNTGLSKQIFQNDNVSVISSSGSSEVICNGNKLNIVLHDPEKHLNTSGKYIALTYDDGPCGISGRTDKIYEILEKYNVKATFFVLGSRITPYDKKQRTLLKTAYQSGFEIGNHTYSHESYPRLSIKGEMQNQITATDTLIKEICGGVGATLLRPPGGIVNSKADLDRPIINWSVDTLDWNQKQSFDGIVHSVTRNTKSGKIVLMHDINGRSAPATDKMIKELIDQGYNFVTVSELMEFSGIDMWAGYIYTDANHEKRTTFCN